MANDGIGDVELGFAEECQDPDDFKSCNFPSKIGGKPVWLDPVSLPSLDQLLCKNCQKPCVLLLQVYAPHTDDPSTFHRSLYIFMCRDPKCFKLGSPESFRVLRCQLPKQNPYYDIEDESDEEPAEDQDPHTSSFPVTSLFAASCPPLCEVCGSPGPSRCGQCLSVHYCSQQHQIYHWKNGHKAVCKDLKSGEKDASLSSATHCPILLPELQIITEPEPVEGGKGKTEKERLKEYEQFTSTESYRASSARNESLLSDQLSKLECTEEIEADKLFETFKRRVAREPEQVIRFQPGGNPLLITLANAPPINIPCCEACGGPRQFELQVMPQLLYYLKLESNAAVAATATMSPSVDWGTLLIYTCTGNCNLLPGYREEFLWKQDPV